MKRKTTTIIVFVMALSMGLMFMTYRENYGYSNRTIVTNDEVSDTIIEPSHNVLTFILSAVGIPEMRLQEHSLSVSVMERLKEGTQAITGTRHVLFLCMYICIILFGGSWKSCLWFFVLFGFAISKGHLSQLKITHQMDGKKRLSAY
ncbi:MAG: hypothetical protein RSA90_05035 [Lachnospiraceae bacterium]